jgi:tellurite methyltransferase
LGRKKRSVLKGALQLIDNHNDLEHQPAQFLVENIELLPRGRVLDVAMGSGRNAIYLARMGFAVEGVDISSDAIEGVLALAKEEGVSIKAHLEDLTKMPRIDKEGYDLVICFNFLQRSLMPEIKDWVKPKGMLVYETFLVDQVVFGKPRNPEYLLKHNELLHTFLDFRVLRYREGIIEGKKAIASILAQKEPVL